MPVIAMTREMGTRGKDVAAGLADELGLEVVHHELVERQVAERMALGESAVHRFLEGRASLLERWKIDSNRLSRYTAEEILQLAGKGNVLIRGWGASQLLREVGHIVCVRVCAPMGKRVAEMKARLGISDGNAVLREIEQNDGAHTRTIQSQFGGDWQNALNYDIVLNTGRIPIETCVAQVRLLAGSAAFKETPETQAALADKLVEARVRTLLDPIVRSAPFGSGLEISVTAGVVTLSGVVAGRAHLDDAIGLVRTIDGVVDVNHEVLEMMQNYGV